MFTSLPSAVAALALALAGPSPVHLRPPAARLPPRVQAHLSAIAPPFRPVVELPAPVPPRPGWPAGVEALLSLALAVALGREALRRRGPTDTKAR